MEYVTLNNGIKMPKLGYGVYQTPPEDTKRCVLDAIEVGYRSIDTAQAYNNEEGVGAALAESGLPREEFFLTTKVWITNAGYEKAKASIAESMRKLRTDYLDLLLIHQPFGDYYGTYRAMEELYKEGKLRAIGVSNFGPDRYLDMQHFAEVKPAVNQIETHVFQQQKTAKEYLKKYDCQIESWGPFAEGRGDMFNNPVLTEIGKKYGKTAAQTAVEIPATGTPTEPGKPTGPDSPQTGDNSNMILWIALLFISGGVLTGVTVFDKRKRHSVK